MKTLLECVLKSKIFKNYLKKQIFEKSTKNIKFSDNCTKKIQNFRKI